MVSSTPTSDFFKRFKKHWSPINQDVYAMASDDLFQNPILSKLRCEMLKFYHVLLKSRDDYQEFLHLLFRFLVGQKDYISFPAPGSTQIMPDEKKDLCVENIPFRSSAQADCTRNQDYYWFCCVFSSTLFMSNRRMKHHWPSGRSSQWHQLFNSSKDLPKLGCGW